jgi:hypothetical protein
VLAVIVHEANQFFRAPQASPHKTTSMTHDFNRKRYTTEFCRKPGCWTNNGPLRQRFPSPCVIQQLALLSAVCRPAKKDRNVLALAREYSSCWRLSCSQGSG